MNSIVSTRKKEINSYRHRRSISENTMKNKITALSKERGSPTDDGSQRVLRRRIKTQTLKESPFTNRNLDLIEKPSIGNFSKYILGSNITEVSFETTKEIELLFHQRNLNSLFQFHFAFASILCGIIDYEINSDHLTAYELQIFTSLTLCTVSSFLLGLTMLIEFILESKIYAAVEKLPENIWLNDRKNLTWLGIKLLFLFLHPNVLLHDKELNTYNNKFEVNIKYRWNSVLMVFLLLRLWFFLKFMLLRSEFADDRMQRICKMNGFNCNSMFTLRANMKKNSLSFYGVFFTLILIYHSYLLRVFESELDIFSGNDFDSMWNSIWCLLISMATVGFGDLYPSTFLGRIVGISGCICGVFLISMSIITITHVFVLDGSERNIYLLLKRVKLSEEKDILAKKLIALYIKMLRLLRKSNLNGEEIKKKSAKELRNKLLIHMIYFREVERQINMTFEINQEEEILDSLHFIEEKIEKLKHQVYKVEDEFKMGSSDC